MEKVESIPLKETNAVHFINEYSIKEEYVPTSNVIKDYNIVIATQNPEVIAFFDKYIEYRSFYRVCKDYLSRFTYSEIYIDLTKPNDFINPALLKTSYFIGGNIRTNPYKQRANIRIGNVNYKTYKIIYETSILSKNYSQKSELLLNKPDIKVKYIFNTRTVSRSSKRVIKIEEADIGGGKILPKIVFYNY